MAHRELDARRQVEIITAIDLDRIDVVVTGLYAWQAKFAQAYVPVLEQIRSRIAEEARISGSV
jgi:hypothetical protein